MELNLGEVQVAGYFTFLMNGEPVFSVPSKNLITDFGWSKLLNMTSAAASTSQVQLGTSNTTPTVADTALGALLASKTATTSETAISGTDTIGVYQGKRYQFDFAQGAVVGNVAEVGFKVATADASLTSRSLVKDGSGNPAVIVATAIDQLTVLYEHRFYLNRTLNVTGSVTIAGTPTTWVIMAAANDVTAPANNITGYKPVQVTATAYGTGFSMGAVGTDPTGTPVASTLTLSGVTVTPAAGTIALTFTLGTANGNATGGILGMLLRFLDGTAVGMGQFGKYKLSFSPAVAKTNTKTFALTFTFTFVRV